MAKGVFKIIWIKKSLKKLYSIIICLVYRAPNTCLFKPTAKVRNTRFEGRNSVNNHAQVYNSRIGFGTYIAQNSYIVNCSIGKYSLVGFEALIGGHPIHKVASVHPALYSTLGQYGFTYAQKDSYREFIYADEKTKTAIVIGNDVWVTAGSTKIVQGVTIGDGAVVMADAVVTKDVPPYAIVGGVPAKIIGYRFSEEQIKNLMKIKWWNRGEEWIQKHVDYFEDVDVLINQIQKEKPDLFD